MKLGEKIKLLRNESQLTQPQLATKAGIEQSYLSKLENDKGSPSFDIINKIAEALGLTGMELINGLSQSYVENNLSHLPEVAAEYANIRSKKEASKKKNFFLASLICVIGVGVMLIGYKNLMFPELIYDYTSNGILKDGEHIRHFEPNPIREIKESREENNQRLLNNRGRVDVVKMRSYEYYGQGFVKEVEGGRRYYTTYKSVESIRVENDYIFIFGIMLITSGFFIFLFNFKSKQ